MPESKQLSPTIPALEPTSDSAFSGYGNVEGHGRYSSRQRPRKSLLEVDPDSYIGFLQETPLLDLISFFACGKCFEKQKKPGRRPRGNTMQLKKKQEQHEKLKERKWFGLFTDLIFVAVIIQFAFQMKFHFKGFYALPSTPSGYSLSKEYTASHDQDCEDLALRVNETDLIVNVDGMECVYSGPEVIPQLIAETIVFWLGFFVAWLELSCGLGRFINISGALDDILYALYLMAVVGMSVQIYPWKMMMKYGYHFSVWLSFAILAQLCIHILYYYVIPECRNYAWRRIWSYAAAIIVNCVGGLFSPWVNYGSIIIACGIIFYVSLTSFIPQKQTDLTVEHFVERFGLLIMIATGQCILALIIGKWDAEDVYAQSVDEHIVIFLAFTIMYIIKDLYLNSDAPVQLHALNKSALPYPCVWVFLHFPLSYCILTVGVGFMLVMSDVDGESHRYGLIVCVPLFASMLIIDLLRATHSDFRWSMRSLFFRIINLVAIPLGGLVFKNHKFLLLWCTVWTSMQMFRDWFWEENYIDGNTSLLVEAPEDKWEATLEWVKKGFMGPKVELWPPYLLVDWWNNKSGASRVKDLYGDLDCHPNEHSRSAREENSSKRDWLMEFVDLIFVGVIWKFADQMKYTLKNYKQFETLWVVLESTLFFTAFFCIWLELMTEFVRFRNMPGIIDDVVRFFYLFGIVLMAIQMENNQYLTNNFSGFLTSFDISLFAILILHIYYLYYRVHDAIRYCKLRIGIYTLVIISTFISIQVNQYNLNVFILLVNVITLLSYSINSFRVTESHKDRHARRRELQIEAEEEDKELDEPIEDHILERFGLFVMITMGESLLALVIAYANYDQDALSYTLIYVAFYMIFFIKIMYFMHNPELEDGHALFEESSPGSVAYCAIHLVLCLSLLWVGVSWKLIFYKWDGSGTIYWRWRMIFAISVTLVMVSIVINRFTHSKFKPDYLSWIRIVPIFAVPCLCYTMADPAYFSIGCCCCFAFLYLMDYRFYNQNEILPEPE